MYILQLVIIKYRLKQSLQTIYKKHESFQKSFSESI